MAGFLSKTLLERHGRFEACPALLFENSREGFRRLVERLRELAPLEHYFILLERTGHYHRPLQQYLQELDLPVYMIHVQSRPAGMLKTDKRDALMLANTLYNQLELGVQVSNKLQLIRRLMPPTQAAAQLKGLIRHRYELVRESTQRKNKLTAICDELFPELVRVVKDPNAWVALALREQFPTPQALSKVRPMMAAVCSKAMTCGASRLMRWWTALRMLEGSLACTDSAGSPRRTPAHRAR
jgi:transposase